MFKQLCLAMAAAVLISFAQGSPLSFAQPMSSNGQRDVLTIKNYDKSESFATSPMEGRASGLEASISSNVIGRAHIAWQSYDPVASRMGRHQLLGRSVEDLTGVFSIEKFIQLWSGSSPGEISIEWLPCS